MSNPAVVSPARVMLSFSWMSRFLARAMAALLCLLCAMPVYAQQSVDKNVQLLKTATDFRVRTQAALALGTSASELAVSPLCSALDDSNRTVRIASATALSRLKKGGQDCLSRRASKESDPRVLSAIKRALAVMGEAEPAIGPSTRFWVAVQKAAGPERLDGVVRAAMIKAVAGRSDVAFVPRGLSTSEAEKLLAAHPQATGFLLAPKLNRPEYSGGMLKIKVSIAIMSYPGSALIGSFSKTVGMGGVSEPDPASENELVAIAAEEAMKQFLSLAPGLSQ